MTKAVCLGLCLGALLAVATPAFANDYGRPGVELGGGISLAGEDFDDDLDDLGIDYDTTAAFDVFVGYRFHPRFSIEGRYQQLLGFDSDDFDDFGFDTDVEISGYEASLNAKLFLLTGVIQPYLSVGGGWSRIELDIDTAFFDVDEDFSDPTWRLGGGIDGWIGEHFAIGLDGAYHIGTGDLDDFNFWTASLLFRFKF